VAFPNNFKPEDHAADLLAAHGDKTAEELAAEAQRRSPPGSPAA
jgi:lysyl-tRNA synthetase class 2